MKDHPLSPESRHPATSVSSSFSHIEHGEDEDDSEKLLEHVEPRPLHSPSSGIMTPRTTASTGANLLYDQALSLVDDDVMVMPFTTPTGHIQMLKHIAPDVVYLQESLAGPNGEVLTHLNGWVGQVAVVVGAEGGSAGIVDSDDEVVQGKKKPGQAWWINSDKIGLGKGGEIVESLRIGEDWGRRVEGKD
jgi:hypothetical protein